MLHGAEGIVSKHAWLKFVIAGNDSLHLLLLILTIEWRVASQQEVGYDTHCPYVHWLTMTRCPTVIHQPSKLMSTVEHILFLKISGAM